MAGCNYRPSPKYDAVVVGSGPNGLAAAITIAMANRSVLVMEAKDTIGGGIRTKELTLPGFNHDVCAAIHPLGLASPFFRSLDLESHGLKWIHPDAPLAHPLDDDGAVLLHRSIEETAEGLGEDKKAYLGLIEPLLRNWSELVYELLKPLGIPRHLLPLIRFGPLAVRSASGVAMKYFRGARARAMFAGNSAHSILPLNRPSSAAFGLMMSILGHAVGWPLAEGGSQSIANALASVLKSFGGEIEVGCPVDSLDDLPSARVTLFDITPRQLHDIMGKQFSAGYRKRLVSKRHGPGVFKLDWALSDPIPWTDTNCLRAATVHIGPGFQDISVSEKDVWSGKEPERPFVLLAQPTLFDKTRAPEGKHIAWAYCHVPNSSLFDMTQRIEDQVERFAPGFKEIILARNSMSTADMQAYNPNYIGGDIVGGIQSFEELFVMPMGRPRAYATPLKGIYICSSSMPPGGGVHGMCGHLAAKRAIKELI
ncbi:MAG: phytoene desaturase family protein [Desulfomonilaceae bacterium]